MSNSSSRAGRSARRSASAPKRPASFSPRSSVRLATAIALGLRAAKCVATSSIISPAPTNSTLVSRRSSNSCDARRTAAAAMLIECAPISVEVRTSLATANERWNIWCSVVPSVPAVVGLAHRLLHLAEDLRLAQHHRIEARWRRGRRGAPRRRLRARRCGRAACWLATPPMPASQSTAGRTSAAGRRAHVELGAVAGGDDRRLGLDALQPLAEGRAAPAPAARARTRTGRAGRAARWCGSGPRAKTLMREL